MTGPIPRTVPMLTAAAKHDPVLAERESLFEYVRNRPREYLIYTAALLGMLSIFFGGSMIARAHSPTVVGVGVGVVGVALIVPMFRQLLQGGAVKWIVRVGPTGRSPLTSTTFVLRGGEQRAAEVYAKIAGSRDARSWPIFNRSRTQGDIRAGVHLRRGSKEVVLTLWVPQGEEALVWPMLTPTADHLDVWIHSIFPRADAANDHATYLQNLNE